MANNITLKDARNKDVIYENVEDIYLTNSEGKLENYVVDSNNNVSTNLDNLTSKNILLTNSNGEDVLYEGVKYVVLKDSEGNPINYITKKDAIPEYNYELTIDQLELYTEGQYRVVYGADCADWQPAVLDVTDTGTLSDPSGILSKPPFNQIKPCLVSKGVLLGYLNPNDFSLFEDGTQADITNTDNEVMIEFPKIYYKLETEWDGDVTMANCTLATSKIYVSNKPKDGYVCLAHTRAGVEYDSIYVSAYENYVQNGVMCCCSGITPNAEMGHLDIMNNLSTLKDNQYTTLNYHFIAMLQILALLLFKEYNGQNTYGNGTTETTSNATGINNTKGMFYGKTSMGTESNKLFGLENIFGHVKTNMDGLLHSEEGIYYIYDPTVANSELNLTGENYLEVNIGKNATLTGYLTRVYADSKYGFLPIAYNALLSNGKKTYFTNVRMSKPSNYNDMDLNICPYMIQTFGGTSNYKYHSFFTYISDWDCSPDVLHSERLICYPLDKKS